ncbi:MAG: hypothetical protein KF851_17940 [Pirellulaceae bacterium]|nr:hypothetical protein [Pirellulaceae bacterium]
MPKRLQDISTFYDDLQRYVGWCDEDHQRIRRLWPLIVPHVSAMIDDFYETINQYEFTRRIITGGAPQIQRLKETLHQWIETLFRGPYDSDFAMSRWRVGVRHVEIGLHQAYAIAAVGRLRFKINEAISNSPELALDEAISSVGSINKLLDIDLALIDLAYQQKAMEQLQLAALEKVQQAERLASIGQMVTGLAHESRNALQRSQASLEALLLDIDDRPDALTQARNIQVALDHLHMLYEEVRNYAAPIILDRESIDAEKIIIMVWDDLKPSWSQYQTQVEFRYRGVAPCVINVDRYRMVQVLTNLFQNAIEAAGTQGKVRCTVTCIGGNQVDVAIEDDGPGVEGNVVPKIFEPFFTTKSKGTGLGLAIAQRIVEAHGGRIQASRSELGGAKFCFSLG